MSLVQAAAWTLSRIAVVATFFDIFYWLNFLANDPYNLGGATLDARVTKPADTCTALDRGAVVQNLILYALWWAQHSIMSRKSFKQAFGLWQSPLGRPVFATGAWVMWLVQVHFWRPITDCTRFDANALPASKWLLHGGISLLGLLFVIVMFCLLPQHVFGTEHHKVAAQKDGKEGAGEAAAGGKGEEQQEGRRKKSRLPFGLGRHPAALGFLWVYLTWPAHTPSHFLLTALTAAFILVPIIFFPEGGLYGSDEYASKLDKNGGNSSKKE